MSAFKWIFSVDFSLSSCGGILRLPIFLFAITEALTFHLRKNSISKEWQLAASTQTCEKEIT